MASGSGRLDDHDQLLTHYFTDQLRGATLQTTEWVDEIPVSECLNVEGVMRKVEAYRQAENSCEKFAVRLRAAGLKALEGGHDIALDACTEVELQLQAESESLPHGEAWVAGFKGLIHACKGEWEAAKNSLGKAIQVEEVCVGSRFFHQFVLCLFAESLGYLMIHAIHPRVPTDCPESSACCKNNHAFYPFLFLCSGESHPGSDVECLVECAKLAPLWPEARCACVGAYYTAARIAAESKSASTLRESLLVGFHMPDALRIPSLEISLWAALGDMEFLQADYIPALTHSARALWFALSMKGEEDDTVEVRALSERILKSAALCYPQKPRPPGDAHSVDVMCYALCVMTLGQPADWPNADGEEWKKARWEEVRLLLGTKHPQSAPAQTFPWIREVLQLLLGIYDRAGEYSSAAEVSILHSRLVDLPSRVTKQCVAAVFWLKAGNMGRALETVQAAVSAAQGLGDSDCELEVRARIHIFAADVWQNDGQMDRAMEAREEALRVCSTRTTLYEFTNPHEIVKGMQSLLQNYYTQFRWSAAYKLVAFMDAYMDTYMNKHEEGRLVWHRWNLLKASIAECIGDLGKGRAIRHHMEKVLAGRVQTGHGDLELLKVAAKFHLRKGEWKLAVRKCEQALKALQEVSLRMKSLEMDMCDMNSLEMELRVILCCALEVLGPQEKFDAELETAVSHVDSPGVGSWQRTQLRVHQARAALRRGDTAAAWTHTQEAETLAGADADYLALVKYQQALVLRRQKQWQSAATVAGEAAVIAAGRQRELCHRDNEPTSWVLFFERNMQDVYWLLQDLWVHRLRIPWTGLLWAERANVRFLLHRIHGKGEEESVFDPVELEKSDTLLANIICATVKSLSPTTAIIHYVYNTSERILYMYVTRRSAKDPSDVFFSCKICHLSTWFKDAGEAPTTRLEALISEARTDIQDREDTKRPIKALVTLHRLLVQYIEGDLEGCDTLTFAPGHGCLSRVPFAALFDERKGKFLIELQATKGVAVIPSITTLYRCLQRQYKFHARMHFPDPVDVPFWDSLSLPPGLPLYPPGYKEPLPGSRELVQGRWQPSKVAFIAGNPEPMGLGLPQLDFSLHEAITVASYFNVQPCVGRDMTKKAVLEGLANSAVVLLATHGIVDEELYPHGCLLMQGPDGCSTSCSHLDGGSLSRETDGGSTSGETDGHMHGAADRDHRSRHVFEGTDAGSRLRLVQEAGQVLTASEIANLEGGIAAGLVVLDTCESGLGEVSGSEGLLGLGRALLEAGAPTAVLTLWKVQDRSQMLLVSRLFHLLYTGPTTRCMTVCEALQLLMEDSIKQGFPIQVWASLSIMGSPLLYFRRPGSPSPKALPLFP